jgi:hypothetical protein
VGSGVLRHSPGPLPFPAAPILIQPSSPGGHRSIPRRLIGVYPSFRCSRLLLPPPGRRPGQRSQPHVVVGKGPPAVDSPSPRSGPPTGAALLSSNELSTSDPSLPVRVLTTFALSIPGSISQIPVISTQPGSFQAGFPPNTSAEPPPHFVFAFHNSGFLSKEINESDQQLETLEQRI